MAETAAAQNVGSPAGADARQECSVPRHSSPVASSTIPHAEPEAVGLSSAALQGLADSIACRVAAGDLVGAEILIIKNGKAILHEALGWSDREREIPLEKNSIYRIRSMTKPFIGTAVLMLYEEGRLQLDDDVAEYLPSFDNDRSRAITIRQLLTHTSGLADLSRSAGLPKEPEEYGSLREVVDAVGAVGPVGPPGTYQYSDAGTATLGALVAERSGMPLERFLEARILAPLGMGDTHTRFAPEAEWADRVNGTYRWSAETAAFTRYWDPSREQRHPYFRASGGLYSTVMDYARFMTMWMDKGRHGDQRVLSEAAVETALRSLAGGEYGMQWQVPQTPIVDGMPTMFGHGGSDGTEALALPAINALVLYFTQSRYHRVPLLPRLSRVPGLEEHVTSTWRSMLLSADSRSEPILPPEQHDRFVGRYIGGRVDRRGAPLPGEWTYLITAGENGLQGELIPHDGRDSNLIPRCHDLIWSGDAAFRPGRRMEGQVREIIPGVEIQLHEEAIGAEMPSRVEISVDAAPFRWMLSPRTPGPPGPSRNGRGCA